MKKESIIIRLGGLALAAVGSVGIATAICDGPPLLALPGAFFWLVGVLMMVTGTM